MEGLLQAGVGADGSPLEPLEENAQCPAERSRLFAHLFRPSVFSQASPVAGGLCLWSFCLFAAPSACPTPHVRPSPALEVQWVSASSLLLQGVLLACHRHSAPESLLSSAVQPSSPGPGPRRKIRMLPARNPVSPSAGASPRLHREPLLKAGRCGVNTTPCSGPSVSARQRSSLSCGPGHLISMAWEVRPLSRWHLLVSLLASHNKFTRDRPVDGVQLGKEEWVSVHLRVEWSAPSGATVDRGPAMARRVKWPDALEGAGRSRWSWLEAFPAAACAAPGILGTEGL